MNLQQHYLTKSTRRGIYGYRRRIGPEYRPLFGGRHEIKQSFGTTSLQDALIKLDQLNVWFEEVIATKGLTQLPVAASPREKVRMLARDLNARQLLPHQVTGAEILGASDDSDFNDLLLFVSLTNEITRVLRELLPHAKSLPQPIKLTEFLEGPPPHLAQHGERLKHLKALRDDIPVNPRIERFIANKVEVAVTTMRRGRVQHRNMKVVEKLPLHVREGFAPVDLAALEVEEYRLSLLKGEPVNLPATWGTAVQEYLSAQNDSVRNLGQVRKWRRDTQSACNRLAAYLLQGADTPLNEIQRADVHDAVRAIWPNASTRKRGCRIYQAVINSWNVSYPDQAVPNVFIKIVSDESARHASKARRSFSPEEFKAVWELVDGEPWPELRLLATLSLYAGIPNAEVVGLDRYDLRVDGESPHLKVRTNQHRILGKKRNPRSIPLVGEVLGSVRAYLADRNFATDTRLFPSFFHKDGRIDNSKIAKNLGRFVVNQIDTDMRQITWYAGRHTFKDICWAAGVSEAHARYLMGHSEAGGGAHKSYGTDPPVSALVSDMEKVANWRAYTWGDYER